MTIQRDHFDGPITFVCDICGEDEPTHCENFGGALAKAKAHGWKVVKEGEEWEHYCRQCQ